MIYMYCWLYMRFKNKKNECLWNKYLYNLLFLFVFRKVVKKFWLIFCDEFRIMLKFDYDVWLYKYLLYGSMLL